MAIGYHPMTDNLPKRPVRGRTVKQERSERARDAIAEGVITVLAHHGVAGLTHRRTAQASGASLAATTYYFASKTDMLAQASNLLLERYLEVFAAAARTGGEGREGYIDFVSRVAANGLERDRDPLLAWFEIMLDGTRQSEARAIARSWYVQFDRLWLGLAEGFHLEDPQLAGQSGVDLTVGAMAHGLGLGWTSQQSIEVIAGRLSADALLGPLAPDDLDPTSRPRTAKSEQTRARLRDAAIDLLVTGGVSVVTYRAVASRAKLTPAAPVYHFGSVDELLAEAQRELFRRQKARYREVVGGAFSGLTLHTLVELTAGVFEREATEFAGQNVAGYAIWMEAAREPQVREHIRPVMSDLYGAWRRALDTLGVPGGGGFEAMCIQFLFVGAQIRVLASGSRQPERTQAGERLKADILALAEQRHWLQSAAGRVV